MTLSPFVSVGNNGHDKAWSKRNHSKILLDTDWFFAVLLNGGLAHARGVI